MKTKMTHTARAELADVVRRRYRSATVKERRRILHEFVATTGYHEKSAIRLLNGQPATKHRQTRIRPSIYDEAARAALIVLWEASDRVCGKRLRALLPILLPALERNGHLKLDETIRSKILAMSAATIDRSLRIPRAATRPQRPSRAVPEPRRRGALPGTDRPRKRKSKFVAVQLRNSPIPIAEVGPAERRGMVCRLVCAQGWAIECGEWLAPSWLSAVLPGRRDAARPDRGASPQRAPRVCFCAGSRAR